MSVVVSFVISMEKMNSTCKSRMVLLCAGGRDLKGTKANPKVL